MAVPEGGRFTCTICYEDSENECIMTCCHREESTMHYCRPCIEIVSADGYGRCPSCRSYFTLSADGEATVVDRIDQCRVCRQPRVIVDEENKICEPCLLGQTYCFKYSCKECQNGQFIPHPMWTYQETPFAYSSVTWSCQQCRAQTKWKIYAEMIKRIPLQHLPESWGRQEEYLAQIRAERQKRCFQQVARIFESKTFNSLVLTPFPIILCGKVIEKFGPGGIVYIGLYVAFLALLNHFQLFESSRRHLQIKRFVFRFVVPLCGFLVAIYCQR
jgi:hypothetical protein